MNPSQKSCSIIIIAYNSCDFIPACLKSIRDAGEGLDVEIIVLDNGSPEPIAPEIKDFFKEVIWIDSEKNLGFGKGCNLAEKKATKPYLFFINPDTIVSRDSLREVLQFMDSHPESGTVGCRILNEDGSLQWACRRSFPTVIGAVSKTIGLATLFPKNKVLASYNMTYANPDEETEVDAISGSFFCIRRDVYEKLNGFDDDFFMYGEDLDLCFRTKKMGLKNYYTPVTNILHFKGQSCRTRRWKSYVDFYQAMLIFARKHKDIYFVPNFFVSLGIIFAALMGVFSRLIPQFWKIFLDVSALLGSLWVGLLVGHLTKNMYDPYMGSIPLLLFIATTNVVFLAFKGEYASSSLKGEGFIKSLLPLNLLTMSCFLGYKIFYVKEVASLEEMAWLSYAVVLLLIPIALLAWRRIAFWINYFYRIFAKKRHRSILLGGGEDSLNNWFDSYNVISGVEILGCVSEHPENITENNRKHLLGALSEMESICNRTGCRELLVVSNFSGFRESFDLEWLKKLQMKVYLLIGNGKNGNYALVDLKNLH